MGNARWSTHDWDTYTSTNATKSAKQIFTATKTLDDLNPLKITLRESRDSDANPRSTPIIIAGDVTGSMDHLAEYMIRTGLGTLAKELYARRPVSDPHLCVAAVGDADYDRSPLQVTQFEADISIAKQLERIHVEGGGGGNGWESYTLPWYFAAMKTSTDRFEKGRGKGVLFTYGDEFPPDVLTKAQIMRVFGEEIERDLDSREVLTMVSRQWDVYHLMVEESHTFSSRAADTRARWRALLSERAISLTDHTKLSEVIVSILEVIAGRDATSVVSSWSGNTALVVQNAIGALSRGTGSAGSGVVRY